MTSSSLMETQQTPDRRASAVSQVLRTLSQTRTQDFWPIPSEKDQLDFRLQVANTRSLREKAYRLAYDVYLASGYTTKREDRFCVNTFDARPHTFTILISTASGEPAGTVSLVFDSPAGLPSDEVFSDQLRPLRTQHRKLVEVTRLAISPDFVHSRVLLVRLFNFIYAYARLRRGADDFIIEVNPRHVEYYRKLLGFEALSPEGAALACPRVQGAPAQLLRLDLAYSDQQIAHGRTPNVELDRSQRRMLYPYFLSQRQERQVSNFLKRNRRPMTEEEAEYFNIAESQLPN